MPDPQVGDHGHVNLKVQSRADMYFPDLSPWGQCPYDAHDAPFKSIGWLSKDNPFQTGELIPEVLAALRTFTKEAVSFWIACGHHRCEFCPPAGPWTLANVSNREILVPARGVIYVAPVLILHYIEAHRYIPPDEFIDALMACPRQLTDEWGALMKQSPYFAERLGLTTR